MHAPIMATATIEPALARQRVLEIGPGRGDFLFHLASLSPSSLVCGVEIKRQRFLKLLERQTQRGLGNIALICGDGRVALPIAFGDAPIDQIYVQFPDPWPKRRHRHHRLVDADFVEVCARCLRPGGEFWFVTDHQPYAAAVRAIIAADPQWQSAYSPPILTESPEAYPTYFAEKWRKEGRTIYYQRYRKTVTN